ncbi:MAG: sulfite exporter TauE/SafE family protein [Planctomycetota bacterium]|nr:MAG: sulfite exporter TauE/SafE family protein [Planctomycetota bacterium]
MLNDWPILFHSMLPVLGFFVGVFGSSTGLGGTIILTPLLATVFGLPYNTAIGTALAQMIGMSLSGLIRHYRLGNVDLKFALNFLVGSLPAAICGRLALQHITIRYGMEENTRLVFNIFYAVAVSAAAISMLIKLIRYIRRRRRGEASKKRLKNPVSRAIVVFVAGAITGFLGGLLALGGGIITLPVLVGIIGVRLETAVGTSVFQMVFMGVAATLTSLGTNDLNWVVIGLLLAGSVPGSLIGPLILNRVVTRFESSRLVKAKRTIQP